MAVDLYINPFTGDIDLTNNVMRLTRNKEESARQQISITLQSYKGEWLFNIDFGISWLANDNNPLQLLGAGNNKGLIDTLIKEAILSRENVIEILTYSSSLDNNSRAMNVSFSAKTDSGEVIFVENATLS